MCTIARRAKRTRKRAAELFRRSRDNGDIYLDTYEGWYNVREETFVTESEAQASGYKDPVSGKDLKKMKEESYFFKQSRYQKQLIAHIESNPEFIQPSSSTKRDFGALAKRRSSRFVCIAHDVRLGHPRARRPKARHVRVVRRAYKLSHRYGVA